MRKKYSKSYSYHVIDVPSIAVVVVAGVVDDRVAVPIGNDLLFRLVHVGIGGVLCARHPWYMYLPHQ